MSAVLLGLAGDSWSGRILRLDPIRTLPGAVSRAKPFGHNAFASERESVRDTIALMPREHTLRKKAQT